MCVNLVIVRNLGRPTHLFEIGKEGHVRKRCHGRREGPVSIGADTCPIINFHGSNDVRGLQVAQELENASKLIVSMFRSGVECYVNTPLFEPLKVECESMKLYYTKYCI